MSFECLIHLRSIYINMPMHIHRIALNGIRQAQPQCLSIISCTKGNVFGVIKQVGIIAAFPWTKVGKLRVTDFLVNHLANCHCSLFSYLEIWLNIVWHSVHTWLRSNDHPKTCGFCFFWYRDGFQSLGAPNGSEEQVLPAAWRIGMTGDGIPLKKNILSFVLQYDRETSGNIVSRQLHLCLQRSFSGHRNLATERSSLDFRSATSASKVRKLQGRVPPKLQGRVPPGLQQPTSTISISISTSSSASCWSLLQNCTWWASRTRIFQKTEIVNASEPSCMLVHLFLHWMSKVVGLIRIPWKTKPRPEDLQSHENAIWNTQQKKYQHGHGQLSWPKWPPHILTFKHQNCPTPETDDSKPIRILVKFAHGLILMKNANGSCQVCANMCKCANYCMALPRKAPSISVGKNALTRELQFQAHSTRWRRENRREMTVIGIRCSRRGGCERLRTANHRQDFTIGLGCQRPQNWGDMSEDNKLA